MTYVCTECGKPQNRGFEKLMEEWESELNSLIERIKGKNYYYWKQGKKFMIIKEKENDKRMLRDLRQKIQDLKYDVWESPTKMGFFCSSCSRKLARKYGYEHMIDIKKFILGRSRQ